MLKKGDIVVVYTTKTKFKGFRWYTEMEKIIKVPNEIISVSYDSTNPAGGSVKFKDGYWYPMDTLSVREKKLKRILNKI